MRYRAPAVTESVDCSILVPVFNEERYIEQTVAAMRAQVFDGQLEFLFADGRSTDRTREILERIAERDPRIRLLDNPNRSVSSGLNVALGHARGIYVARMDAHTVYPADYVQRAVARLSRGDTRWVSGPQTPTGRGPVSRAVTLALSTPVGRGGSRKWGHGDARGQPEFELDTGVFCGAWKRSTLLEYGGWDERWPQNEDSELAARFLANGERLICVPALGAQYVPRDSLGGLWTQYRRYGRFRARTARRHPASMRASQVLPPGVVIDLALAVAAPRLLSRPARAALVVYLGSLGYATARARTLAGSVRELALVPAVLATMHLAHGVGMLEGFADYGLPTAALARIVGLDRVAAQLQPPLEPVHAPSLAVDRAA